MKILTVLVIAACLVLPLGIAAPVSAQSGISLTVTADALNVRSGPGTGYPVIGALKGAEKVTASGRNAGGDWLQVQLATRSGWVSAAWVQAAGDVSGLLVVAAPAMPAASVQGGASTIVFQASSGGTIYAVNPDGSGLRRLTVGIDPAISPDGRWVAFTRWDNSGTAALGGLWLIRLDGSGERLLHGEVRQPKSPAWSPDGKRIVLNMQHGGRTESIRMCRMGPFAPPGSIDVETTELPNGAKQTCFTIPEDPGWGLRLVEVDTGKWRDLPHDIHSYGPTWNPTNDWQVVYVGDAGLMNLDVNRDAVWPLAKDDGDRSATFSPNGQRLAVSYRQHDHWEVHTLDLGGGSRARLTETPITVLIDQRLKGQPERTWNNAAPAWSPDGSRIAFLTDRTGRWEIWTMNADGSNQRALLPSSVYNQVTITYAGMDERMISWR